MILVRAIEKDSIYEYTLFSSGQHHVFLLLETLSYEGMLP